MGIVLSNFLGELPGTNNYDLPTTAASFARDCEFGGTLKPARFYSASAGSAAVGWPVKVYGQWFTGDTPNKYIQSPLANDAAKRVYWVEGGVLYRGSNGSTNGSPVETAIPTGYVSSNGGTVTTTTAPSASSGIVSPSNVVTVPTPTANGNAVSVAVLSAYSSVARWGFGDGPNQIDQAGYDYWVGLLNTGQLTLSTFLPAFYAAISIPQLVSQAYSSLRFTDPDGAAYWENQLRTGELTYYNFLPTFYAAANFSYVVDYAYSLLGRAPDADGRAYWIARLTTGSTKMQNFLAEFLSGASVNKETFNSSDLTDAKSAAYDTVNPDAVSGLTHSDIANQIGTYRAYVYTISKVVGTMADGSPILEEGPPSAPSIIGPFYHGYPAKLKIEGEMAASGSVITLYRASYGSYLYVGTVDTPNNFTDDTPDDALGEACPSTDWLPPPPLAGILPTGQGFFIGWKDTSLYCSELYLPHAWPAGTTYTLKYNIRRCISTYNGILAITDNGNYFISGQTPTGLGITEVPTLYPCIADDTAVNMGNGIVYVSPTGLALISTAGSELLTDGAVDPSWWSSQSFVGARAYRLMDWYVLSFSAGTYVFDMRNKTISESTRLPTSGTFDQANGGLRTTVGELLANSFAPSYTWTSKVFEFNNGQTFGWTQCIAASYPVSVTWHLWQSDGAKTTRVVAYANHHPVRFPSNRWHRVQAEIVTASPVSKLVLTSDRKELEYLG
jgi:hypothetical protein